MGSIWRRKKCAVKDGLAILFVRHNRPYLPFNFVPATAGAKGMAEYPSIIRGKA